MRKCFNVRTRGMVSPDFCLFYDYISWQFLSDYKTATVCGQKPGPSVEGKIHNLKWKPTQNVKEEKSGFYCCLSHREDSLSVFPPETIVT